MTDSIRREDSKNLTETTQAVRAMVFGAHPELSVGQVAAAITRGGDDPMPVSEDTLQAAMIGVRKLPLHKTGFLKRHIESVTGRPARHLIDVQCKQAGGLYVEIDGVGEGTLIGYIREFSEGAQAASDALDDGEVTDAELVRCVPALRQAASTALSLLSYIETLHRRGANA